jgi:regulator of cell morphogenesis and NO signaling
MFIQSKTFITPQTSITRLIKENPLILLVIENFGIYQYPKGSSVHHFCKLHNINEALFIQICNLHNGYYIDHTIEYQATILKEIIQYLHNSHVFYRQEKYPEILNDIKKLSKESHQEILGIIEKYFEEYFNEVNEHIEYEEQTAFPYFHSLMIQKQERISDYSAMTYQDHHTDIESKLDNLKELFIEHVHFNQPNGLRRKILNDLSELEFELKIHAQIEDLILIPLVDRIEKMEGENG